MMQLHDAKNDYKYEGNSGNIFMGEKKKKKRSVSDILPAMHRRV